MIDQPITGPRASRQPSLFSIVTVVLNDCEGLQRTHRSLNDKTCRDFDWIVVDGGSHDGTPEYLAANQRDSAWWRSAPDRGLYDAMNIGLSAAVGEYVIFLNAGDTLAEADTLKNLAMRVTQGDRPDFMYG